MSNSQSKRQAVGDLILCGFVFAGSAVLFVGASTLPPPRYEPLGSAAMPRILGVLLIVLASVVAFQAIANLRNAHSEDVIPFSGSPYRGLIVLAALVGYVFALDVLQLNFLIATMCFVAIAGTGMHRFSVKSVALHAALGLVIAALISTVFSRFLGIEIG